MGLSYSEKSAILCVLQFLFLLFYSILENIFFLAIFDTCDVMYN